MSKADVRWNYSPVDEDRLVRHYGISPTRTTVKLSDINWGASLKNQNRPTGYIDMEHVRDIAVAMANGDIIDCPIVRQNGRGLYIIDGNHRGRAAQDVGEAEWDVWLVDCPDETADTMAEFANIGRHGRGVSAAHRMEVVEKHLANGMDPDELCKLAGIKRTTLDAYKMRAKAERKTHRTLGVQKQPSHKQSVAINRLEDDELRILGPIALDVPAGKFDEWSQRIASQKPKEREAMAHQVRGEMLVAKSTGVKKNTHLTEARRGLSVLMKNLRRAMDEAPKAESDKLYDQVHALYLTAQEMRAGDASA